MSLPTPPASSPLLFVKNQDADVTASLIACQVDMHSLKRPNHPFADSDKRFLASATLQEITHQCEYAHLVGGNHAPPASSPLLMSRQQAPLAYSNTSLCSLPTQKYLRTSSPRWWQPCAWRAGGPCPPPRLQVPSNPHPR
jgi:hypothetical protein